MDTIPIVIDLLSRYPLILLTLSLFVWIRPQLAATWLGAILIGLLLWGLYFHQQEIFEHYYTMLATAKLLPASYTDRDSAMAAFNVVSIGVAVLALGVPLWSLRKRG